MKNCKGILNFVLRKKQILKGPKCMNLENGAWAFHKNSEILVALNKSECMEFDDVGLRNTS
jgi:hypothetical protein